MSLPFSAACERNRGPILAVLRAWFAGRRHVLEVGSGTGQHAVHFAGGMPWLQWQPSDHVDALEGIGMWRDEAALPNVLPPFALQVTATPAPAFVPAPVPQPRGADGAPCGYDAVFTANTLHIMGWDEAQALFAALPALLADDAVVAVYGPFNLGGMFTSHSNREFDAMLRARDPRSGLRDLEAVVAAARAAGLQLHDDVAMPANNRLLLFTRRT